MAPPESRDQYAVRRSDLSPPTSHPDNAMIEAFWSCMQVELLDSRPWKIRVELANAIFESIEMFRNRRRRYSSLAAAVTGRCNSAVAVARSPSCSRRMGRVVFVVAALCGEPRSSCCPTRASSAQNLLSALESR